MSAKVTVGRLGAGQIKVTFTVLMPTPPMSAGPMVVTAANDALIRLAKAYYENNENIIMAIDNDDDVNVDMQIVNGPLGG